MRVVRITASQTESSDFSILSPDSSYARLRRLNKQDPRRAGKKKNTQSGTEFQRTKEQQAAIMREKQAKAEAKKSEGGADTKKK
ncbi:hypothetical protein CLCR_06299 [Cladophialophora carrionii]|uniref:Small EDRK-rich factor-like N-terminal domain-containing protein n=1 Tax=Cladophialophora carrionii TaxID=86049 RepID=A0A1C1C7W2_9EURO|nr:hypothetical protein CLCR_06299 [Cladophialophora carrionii]